MQMRGISPLISAVILIALIFAIASIVSPWINTLTRDVTNQTSSTAVKQIECNSLAYDFDTSYGVNGISNGITNTTDTLNVKIVNTGKVNIHTFSFEIEMTMLGGEMSIRHFPVNTTSQKTQALPLKPGQSAILKMNISEDLNGSLHEIKILNSVCENIVLKQRL